MHEPMVVFVTPAELEEIRRLHADAELSGDQTKLAGFIQGCCSANGGTFSRALALRGVLTKLCVIEPPSNVKIQLTVISETPLDGQEKI